jgi:hypothetical protein
MIDLATLQIFPCNLAKEPLTAHGFNDAKPRRGWKGWPLVGFPTGVKSGFDVLDIDPTGREWFDANFDALPQTLAHSSQRGLHLVFRHGAGLRCSSGKIAEGVDVRANGGYAIYWPATGLPVEDHPVCEWPDWLLAEAMAVPQGYPSKKNEGSREGINQGDPIFVADLTAALREMDAVDWRGKHDPWFELLMGCKFEGISLADFTAWCVSDPVYVDDAEIIERKWHSVEPRHGGALWRELNRRKIRVRDSHSPAYDKSLAGVPLEADRRPVHQKTFISPSRRLNRILDEIEQRPTERVLFSYACLVAEIVHECGLSPSVQAELLRSRASLTPLWKSLGSDGVERTIANAFRHVEERLLLATPNGGQKEETDNET